MDAIAGRYGPSEAAVLALEAGADLVLMPGDADGAIDAIVAAVASGRLGVEQLQASQQRRRLALGRCPADDGGTASAPLGGLSNGPAPADKALARELVRHSLVSRGRGPVPGGPGVNLIRLDNSLA